MRDRRNTEVSMSSTDSTNSTSSPRSTRSSLHEKRHSSPPPRSPTLPAPVTKEKRSNTSSHKVMLGKALAAICGLIILWRFLFGLDPVSSIGSLPTSESPTADTDTELVGGDDLPSDPTALIVLDPDGTSKWTISIPHNSSFPLTSHYYKDICRQGAFLQDGISANAQTARGRHWWRKHRYHAKDETFLDISDAEKVGALPHSILETSGKICESSMTFVLESEEASFGKSLLLLWLSYGIAQKEGRAFFIDDTRWAWGNYETYFLPPPSPGCVRPPSHHVVPCPRHARHVVVSSATAAWTFGSAFREEFEEPRHLGLGTPSRPYALLRAGYQALFKLTGEDALYAASRIAKLKDDAASHHTPIVGLQVRRGDLHPFEYQYSRDYLPLERYADGARALLRSQTRQRNVFDDPSSPTSGSSCPVLIASDDPDIINAPELQQSALPFTIQQTQERIQLATKETLDMTSPVTDLREPGSAYVKHIDENSGWEGGFYSALFFALGGAKRSELDPDHRSAVPEQALRLRELVGRAYLMDLAVLGQSDGVVCAVSSASCRLLAVMLGWDAVKEGRWMNVDDGRRWSWDGHR